MTDFELNKAILRLLCEDVNFIERYTPNSDKAFASSNAEHGNKTFDLNNWNDLMPLVIEHEIEYSLQIGGDYLVDAYVADKDCFTIVDNNIQRALAECLLKVLEFKQCAK